MDGTYPWLFSAIILICITFWIWLLTQSNSFRKELTNIVELKDKGGKSAATLIKICKFLLTAKDTYIALNFIILVTIICSGIGFIVTNIYVIVITLFFFLITIVWIFTYIVFIIKIHWGFL